MPNYLHDALTAKIMSKAEEEYFQLSNDSITSDNRKSLSGEIFSVYETDLEYYDALDDYDEYLRTITVSDTQSHLPNMLEIIAKQREGKMRVENLVIGKHEWKDVVTKMDTENKDTYETWPLSARMCEITNESVLGYVPSKIFNTGWDEFLLMFYINDTLPEAVRAFKKKTYMMWAPICKHESLLYDVNARMFMDQIKTETGLIYVFLFDEDNYDLIVRV